MVPFPFTQYSSSVVVVTILGKSSTSANETVAGLVIQSDVVLSAVTV